MQIERIEQAMQQAESGLWAQAEEGMSTLGWILIAILVLVVMGVIGFSFNA